MKGTTFMLLDAVFLTAAILLMMVYITSGKKFWSKSYNLLLLGWLKLDLAIARFGEDIKLLRSHIFKGYTYDTVKAAGIAGKEQRLSEHKRNMKECDGYYRRESYNRKILD